MKALIELGGDWQNNTVTAYIHPKYTDQSNPNYVDCEATMRDGFDYIIHCDSDWVGCNLKVANAPEYENRSFVFLSITNPFKVFDKSKVKCSVPLEVVRTHSLFGWLAYSITVLLYKIKTRFA